MDEMCRSKGKAEIAPVAPTRIKATLAQSGRRTSNISEPEEQKGPPRRGAQGNTRAAFSSAKCDNDARDDECNKEGDTHPRQRGGRQPIGGPHSEAALLRHVKSTFSDFLSPLMIVVPIGLQCAAGVAAERRMMQPQHENGH